MRPTTELSCESRRERLPQYIDSEKGGVGPICGSRESEKDMVLGLLQRETGATLAELMTVTGWRRTASADSSAAPSAKSSDSR